MNSQLAVVSEAKTPTITGLKVNTLQDSLTNIARKLKTDIVKSAPKSEEEKRLTPEIVEKLYAEGLFNLWVPECLGGPDIDPLTALKFLEEIASYDASTAWSLMIGIEMNGFICNYAPDEIIQSFFSGAEMAISGGVVMPGGSLEKVEDDNYAVTGLWPYGSGCHQCSWMLGSCILMEDGMPVMGSSGNPALYVAMMPKSKIYINDTWHTLGMNGTGSHHWGTKDQRISETQVWPVSIEARRKNKALNFPWAVLFAVTKASIAMGVAKAAVDHYRNWITTTTPFGSNYFISEDSCVQLEFAKRFATYSSARAFLFGTISDIWNKVEKGQKLDEETIALGHLAAVKAAEDAYSVVNDLFYLSGATTTIYDKKPMQKFMRDMTTLRSHVALSNKLYEASGAALLGADPVTIMPFWDLNYK